MPNFICTTCGTQYAESDQPPAACAICQDERQYVKATGQQWTTLDRLRLTNRNSIRFEEPGLIGIGIEPHFAIGQRALFLRTPTANVLWDCLPLLDEAVVDGDQGAGRHLGHRHLAPALLFLDGRMEPGLRRRPDLPPRRRPPVGHAARQGHRLLGRRNQRILGEGLTLVRCGGHFEGGTVLHWAGGAERQGCSADRRHHSGRRRPQARQLHVLLPELHPAVGVRRSSGSCRPWSRSSTTGSTGHSGTW